MKKINSITHHISSSLNLQISASEIIIPRLSSILFIFIMTSLLCVAQHIEETSVDSLSGEQFQRGAKNVNKCTPWHHLQCVYITGSEVYQDGRNGKHTRHWWRMSYIGRACSDQYGKTFGHIFEGLFVVPHYIGVGLGNGIGFIVHLLRPSPEVILERKRIKRERKKAKRELKKSVRPWFIGYQMAAVKLMPTLRLLKIILKISAQIVGLKPRELNLYKSKRKFWKLISFYFLFPHWELYYT